MNKFYQIVFIFFLVVGVSLSGYNLSFAQDSGDDSVSSTTQSETGDDRGNNDQDDDSRTKDKKPYPNRPAVKQNIQNARQDNRELNQEKRENLRENRQESKEDLKENRMETKEDLKNIREENKGQLKEMTKEEKEAVKDQRKSEIDEFKANRQEIMKNHLQDKAGILTKTVITRLSSAHTRLTDVSGRVAIAIEKASQNGKDTTTSSQELESAKSNLAKAKNSITELESMANNWFVGETTEAMREKAKADRDAFKAKSEEAREYLKSAFEDLRESLKSLKDSQDD